MSQSDDLMRNDSGTEPAGFGRALRLHAYGGREALVIDRVPNGLRFRADKIPTGNASPLAFGIESTILSWVGRTIVNLLKASSTVPVCRSAAV